MKNKFKKAQGLLEVVLLIVVIAAGLIATSIYLKRSFQGRLRATADDIGEQYSPTQTSSSTTIATDSKSETTTSSEEEAGKTQYKTKMTTDETTSRTGYEETQGGNQGEPLF